MSKFIEIDCISYWLLFCICSLYDQIVSVNKKSVLGLKVNDVRGILTAAPAGELRVGLVRPRDRTVIEKLVTEQEQHKKSKRCVYVHMYSKNQEFS